MSALAKYRVTKSDHENEGNKLSFKIRSELKMIHKPKNSKKKFLNCFRFCTSGILIISWIGVTTLSITTLGILCHCADQRTFYCYADCRCAERRVTECHLLSELQILKGSLF